MSTLRYIPMQSVPYEGDWPVEGAGDVEDPAVSYATHEEAMTVAREYTGQYAAVMVVRV